MLNRTSGMMLVSLLAVTVTSGCLTAEDELPAEIASTAEEVSDDDDPRPADPAALGNTCRDTEIIITNWRHRDDTGPTRLDVRSVEYYSASEGRWYSEDLPNTLIDYGDTFWFWDQDLAHADGDLITKWRVHYYYVYYTWDGWYSWSDTQVYQEVNTTDETCHDNDNFGMTVY